MPYRPCLGGLDGQRCRVLAKDASRCPQHDREVKRAAWARQDARRPSPTQRGLGAEHRHQVKAMKAAIIAEQGALPTHCPCGRAITPSNPWSGDHELPRVLGGQVATTLRCLACNSAGGTQARLAAQATHAAQQTSQGVSATSTTQPTTPVTVSDDNGQGVPPRGVVHSDPTAHRPVTLPSSPSATSETNPIAPAAFTESDDSHGR